MRYSSDHKLHTRVRILDAASQAFRERGVAETGIHDVMRRAGLTHGGFYAHFRDKAELVAEACAAGFAEAVPNLARIAAVSSVEARVRLLVESYLSVRHRDNRGSGCLIVAVAADMARLPGPARASYSAGLSLHLRRLATALQLSKDPVENYERVTHLMSSLVGALLFARATEDPAESGAILRAARRRLRAEFTPASTRTPAAQAPKFISPSHDLLRSY
jgi:TetR/AcrR family transcriptional repressor of nem operon